MSATFERILEDRKNSLIVNKRKNALIKAGCYPKKFNAPISLQLELTSTCNCHCSHCYNRSGEGFSENLMTSERWLDFCRKLVAGGGIFQATISGGEPLTQREYLWDLMDILGNDGTIFNLITNGFLFSQDVLKHLLKYKFYWIQVSIDAPYASFHDEFRHLQGCWEKAIRAAYAIALSGIPLRVASTVTPKTLNCLEDFVKMSINLGASYLIIGEVVPSGRAVDNSDIFLSNEERDRFYLIMKDLREKYVKDISILISGSQRVQLEYACENSLDGAIIRPDGSIRLDCSCPFVIGNVLKDDIFDVWKKAQNCWSNSMVKKYIESCDPITGKSDFIANYNDGDVSIYE